MTTLILDRSAVVAAADLTVLGDELGGALARYSPGGAAQRVRAAISETVTAMVLVPGRCDGIPAYTVKVHAKVPAAAEPITGVILLHELTSGELLAIIDSGWLTAQRTALTAAFVHDRFVDPAEPVAIVGAGVQGSAVAHALARRRPRRLVIADTNPSATGTLADALAGTDSEAVSVGTAGEALAAAPSAITATWGAAPIAPAAAFASVRHVTMLGADEPGKRELPAEVLDRIHLHTDDPTLAEPVLGRVATAVQPLLNRDRTVDGPTGYAAVGLPLQDVVGAWHVYHRATARGLGTPTALRQ